MFFLISFENKFNFLNFVGEEVPHVHFDVIKDDFESDNNPVITSNGKTINIHLGFLQTKHRYKIELKLPGELLNEFTNNDLNAVLRADEAVIPNINCKLLSFNGKATEESTMYEAEIEFFAHKEKLLKEELKLISSHQKSVKFVFHARVLGRGKGTPMLRNGVHLTGIEDDEESDASDWQGFSRQESDEL